MTLFQSAVEGLPDHLRLLLDENISPRAARAMNDLLLACKVPAQIITIVDHKKEYGHFDSQWVRAIAPENWVVVSADRGKSNRGQRLPRICRNNGVRHILLGPSVHSQSSFNKVRMLLGVWDEIWDVMHAPAGSRFILQFRGRARLERRD